MPTDTSPGIARAVRGLWAEMHAAVAERRLGMAQQFAPCRHRAMLMDEAQRHYSVAMTLRRMNIQMEQAEREGWL